MTIIIFDLHDSQAYAIIAYSTFRRNIAFESMENSVSALISFVDSRAWGGVGIIGVGRERRADG